MNNQDKDYEIARLKDELDHLKRCKEFESNLQLEIIKVGSKYVDMRRGTTFSSTDAWWAIQKRLKETDD